MSGLDVATAAVDLVFSSTLTDHPELRVVLLEAGGGLLPYLAERIDFFRTQRPESWPLHDTRTAAQIFRDQVYASFIDDPLGVHLRDALEPSHLLWQSDFPHADSFWPNSRARISSALLADVPDDEARAIAGGNALAAARARRLQRERSVGVGRRIRPGRRPVSSFDRHHFDAGHQHVLDAGGLAGQAARTRGQIVAPRDPPRADAVRIEHDEVTDRADPDPAAIGEPVEVGLDGGDAMDRRPRARGHRGRGPGRGSAAPSRRWR